MLSSSIDAGQVRVRYTYNADTGEIFSSNGRRVGSKNSYGYIVVRFKFSRVQHRFLAHRLAWLASHGSWPIGEVDHINGCRSDNRLSNLRCVDRSTNMQNQQKAQADNKTSGVLGVSYSSGRGKWVAQIQTNGKKLQIGRFDTLDAARVAYLQAKRQLHAGCTI